jgi:hypothetical protein
MLLFFDSISKAQFMDNSSNDQQVQQDEGQWCNSTKWITLPKRKTTTYIRAEDLNWKNHHYRSLLSGFKTVKVQISLLEQIYSLKLTSW